MATMIASFVAAAPARAQRRSSAAAVAARPAKPASFEGFRASPSQKFAGSAKFASVTASRTVKSAAARTQVVTQAGYKVSSDS